MGFLQKRLKRRQVRKMCEQEELNEDGEYEVTDHVLLKERKDDIGEEYRKVGIYDF